MEMWITQWISWHTGAIAIGLLLYVVATQGLQQRRPPTAAVAWVLLIALLPYLGIPLFLLFGTRKLRRAGPAPGTDLYRPRTGSDSTDPLDTLARALNLPPAVGHEAVRLHADGTAALHALLDVIDQARQRLHICTYVIGDDTIGAALVDRVRARIAAGVTVRILLDGVGGIRSWRVARRLRACGAQVVWFVPPLRRPPLLGRANLRNHRKLVVADGARVWSGGRNLAAEYFEGAVGAAPWMDLSFDTGGPLAAALDEIFVSDWSFATGRAMEYASAPPVDPAHHLEGIARPVPSGPDYADDTLYALLLLACYRSQASIEIATPYFVPDESLLHALCLAARRGVRVRLLLPARSNHRLADLARRRSLLQMTSAGVQVCLHPAMLHAKLVAIDDAWLLLGSANIDSRSLFLNYELMVALQDRDTITRAVAWFDATAGAAQPWRAPAGGIMRDLGDGLLLWLAFQL